jgi:hypothetical protein
LEYTKLFTLTEPLDIGIVFGDKGLVVQVALEYSLQGLERPEVYNPVADVQLVGRKFDSDLDRVAMQEPAMRVGAPLSKGAAQPN